MVTSLPFPAPVGPCQSLFATARCRYPRHHAKPPGPPSVSVRLAPPSPVLSGFRRLVSPRSRTCPSLHFPACPCSRSRTCAFLRQSALSAPGRAHQAPFCARGLLKTGAVSENAPGAHGIVPRAGRCSTVAVPAQPETGSWFGEGLATRQDGDVLLGGASGAGSLLLNTKASQEAACSRAPAAIVPGRDA